MSEILRDSPRNLFRHLCRLVQSTGHHAERNLEALGNELIDRAPRPRRVDGIRRRQRLGGLLNYYYRAALCASDSAKW